MVQIVDNSMNTMKLMGTFWDNLIHLSVHRSICINCEGQTIRCIFFFFFGLFSLMTSSAGIFSCLRYVRFVVASKRSDCGQSFRDDVLHQHLQRPAQHPAVRRFLRRTGKITPGIQASFLAMLRPCSLATNF